MPLDRPPVLLLHGALGAAATMAPLAERLTPHFTVHGLDFRGHGASPDPGVPLTMELLAEQVAAYVTAHGLAPARIFGHSLGGYVALQLAEARPALVSRVATLAMKLACTPEISAHMRRQFDPATIRARAPRVADALAALHTGMGWEHLLPATSTMLDDLGARPRLTRAVFARITHPVRLGATRWSRSRKRWTPTAPSPPASSRSSPPPRTRWNASTSTAYPARSSRSSALGPDREHESVGRRSA